MCKATQFICFHFFIWMILFLTGSAMCKSCNRVGTNNKFGPSFLLLPHCWNFETFFLASWCFFGPGTQRQNLNQHSYLKFNLILFVLDYALRGHAAQVKNLIVSLNIEGNGLGWFCWLLPVHPQPVNPMRCFATQRTPHQQKELYCNFALFYIYDMNLLGEVILLNFT